MPYMAICRLCNHHSFGRDASLLEEDTDLHGMEKHGVSATIIIRISEEQYREFLAVKDSPRFWWTIRHYRKLARVCGKL
jgi:hypothetical protein